MKKFLLSLLCIGSYCGAMDQKSQEPVTDTILKHYNGSFEYDRSPHWLWSKKAYALDPKFKGEILIQTSNNYKGTYLQGVPFWSKLERNGNNSTLLKVWFHYCTQRDNGGFEYNAPQLARENATEQTSKDIWLWKDAYTQCIRKDNGSTSQYECQTAIPFAIFAAKMNSFK